VQGNKKQPPNVNKAPFKRKYSTEGTGAHGCLARGGCGQLAAAFRGMESACVGKTEQIVTLLALSHFEPGRAPTASMLAAARPHCILHARDLRMLAFDFGLCRWSAFFGRSLVVYYRIAQISRLNLACAGPLSTLQIKIKLPSKNAPQIATDMGGKIKKYMHSGKETMVSIT